MKLLILSESPLIKYRSDYYAVDPWIKIPCYLSEYCEQVTLWAPVKTSSDSEKPPKDSWRVDLKKLQIEPNDYYVRFVDYYRLLPRKFLAWQRTADRLVQAHDRVIIRAPSPMGPLLVKRANRQGRPIVFMILLNILTQSDRLITSRGPRRWLYSAIVKGLLHQEKKAVQSSKVTYVYSRELAERHRQNSRTIRMIQDPHLSLRDIVMHPDTCQEKEIRLLRLCWLIPSKGVEYLMEAVALLLQRGFPVRLEIVGQERVAGYQTSLEEKATRLGIRDKILFSGWLPFDRVHEAYLRNDIQILSSLGEGTPRCIVEGFARGLPLVCSDIGGCHDTLTHERDALLVPPADPAAIADAVARLITEKNLRKKLIEQGYATARSVTFENLGMQFLDEIKNVV